jgi:hypothetical protein
LPDREKVCIAATSSVKFFNKLYLYQCPTYGTGLCQLKLASRERVLISCAKTGIKIWELGLGGKIPTKTIADWPVSKLTPFVHIFADETNPSLHPLEVIKNPLEVIKNKLMTCSSIREIEHLCAGKR